MEKNYYQILGLKKGASLEEIKVAYRKYVVKFHPDKHNNDEFFKERFHEIQEAYEYLINKPIVIQETEVKTYESEENYEDYEEEGEEFYNDAPTYTCDNINFQCSHSEIGVGDIINLSWSIDYQCFVSIKLDNGKSQKLFESLPIKREKCIEIKALDNVLKVTLICSNENSLKTKVLEIPAFAKPPQKEKDDGWIWLIALIMGIPTSGWLLGLFPVGIPDTEGGNILVLIITVVVVIVIIKVLKSFR